MTTTQLDKVKRFGKVAGVCLLGAYGCSKVAEIPEVIHMKNLFADSFRYSFSARPPTFETIGNFAQLLRNSNSKSGFGEVAEMKAVYYDPITKAPLNMVDYRTPERFSITGNLVGCGRTKDGGYYYDLGDNNKADIRICASEDVLPNFNLLGATGMHKAIITFKQGSVAEEQDQIITVSTTSGHFKMCLDDARFNY